MFGEILVATRKDKVEVQKPFISDTLLLAIQAQSGVASNFFPVLSRTLFEIV